MAEIEQLPPPYRVPPTRPGAGAGQGNRAPQRKPDDEGHRRDRRRHPDRDDGAASHIDEYA